LIFKEFLVKRPMKKKTLNTENADTSELCRSLLNAIKEQGFLQYAKQKHFSKPKISNNHGMSILYNSIMDEFLEITPENVNITPPPYDLDADMEIKILYTYQRLQRSARRKDRRMTLVYAYYLGELIENTTNRHQKGYLNSQISSYYSIVSRRTYYLFEKIGIEQIYRTKHLTITKIYKLKFAEYQLLIGS